MKKPSEICVPLKSLALPGATGDVTPSPGDEIDITGTATVSRIEGDGPDAQAYITLKTINDQPIDEEAGEPPSLDDEETEMRADAQASDAKRIY